ncbi:MAG: C40 family peptidase [Nocardioidaceae bacterium]|nr:C40 family peptidase [Nocardioidaceae bacterium]
MSRSFLPARVRRRLARLLAGGLVATSGVMALSAAPAEATITRAQRLDNALEIAINQVGDPYRYGSAGPGSFDCSGLLYYSMRKAGFSHFPRTSDAQAGWGRPVSKSHLRRGDLVFFHHRGDVYHAAIFLRWYHGHAVILHSPRPGDHVRRDRPWTTEWFARTGR